MNKKTKLQIQNIEAQIVVIKDKIAIARKNNLKPARVDALELKLALVNSCLGLLHLGKVWGEASASIQKSFNKISTFKDK